jgi:hypothetical protein
LPPSPRIQLRDISFPKHASSYGEAIIRLNEALQDSVTAKKDETLMAVLLMGRIEVREPAKVEGSKSMVEPLYTMMDEFDSS